MLPIQNFLLPSASSWKEDRDSRSYTSRGTATTIAVGYTLESREPPSDGGHHSVQQQQQQRDDCDDNTHPTPNGVQESCGGGGGGGASIGGDVVDEGVSKKPPTRIATADIAHCGEVESSGIEESVSKEPPTRTMTAEGATTGGGVGPSGIEEGVS